MKITFEELNENIVAVDTKSIQYDYFKRWFEIVITPDYGVKEAYKNRLFKITFSDCICISFINTSLVAKEGETEFIGWGKVSKKSKVKEKLDKYSSELPFKDLSRDIILNRNEVKDLNIYNYYFFENVIGDGIDIIASEVNVEEVFEK